MSVEKELTSEQLEISRLKCLTLRLRIGMIQIGLEGMQKDFALMQKELMQKQKEFGASYDQLKIDMDCPENNEINLETGDFVPKSMQTQEESN